MTLPPSAEQVLGLLTVKASRDGKSLHGTGFFVDAHHILTCYHVLVPTDADTLGDTYYVRHDDWEDWVAAKPVVDRCQPRPQDIAMFHSPRRCVIPTASGHLGPFPLTDWDARPGPCWAKGYDLEKDRYQLGATTVCGRIQGRTTRRGVPRLHLQTEPGTILQGRSGSPLWSVRQQAIVGLVTWAGPGLESGERSLDLAIPLELALPELEGRARCYCRVRTPRLRQQEAYRLVRGLRALESRASRAEIITPQLGDSPAVSVLLAELQCAMALELDPIDDPQLVGLKRRYLKRLRRLSESVAHNRSQERPLERRLISRLLQAHTKLFNRIDRGCTSLRLEQTAFNHWCHVLRAADAIWKP